jgi:GDP-L-fucose synthase
MGFGSAWTQHVSVSNWKSSGQQAMRHGCCGNSCMSQLKKILLLGKSGFIGRNAYDYLAGRADLLLSAPTHFELDVLDETSVVAYLKHGSFDVVVNCLDRHSDADAAYGEQRLRMYYNLAHHNDLFGKMIYFGTGAEYGRQTPLERISEQDFGRHIPLDSYGFAMFQMACHALQSNNIYNLRLFGIFGPHELWRTRFISNCICKALFGFPLTIRQDRRMDYLYTDDLCGIISWTIDHNLTYHAYNATSGKSYLLTELAQLVIKQSGKDLAVFVAEEGLADEYSSDNSLLKREMQDFSKEPIEESIRKLYAFYGRNQATLDKESLLYNY